MLFISNNIVRRKYGNKRSCNIAIARRVSVGKSIYIVHAT